MSTKKSVSSNIDNTKLKAKLKELNAEINQLKKESDKAVRAKEDIKILTKKLSDNEKQSKSLEVKYERAITAKEKSLETKYNSLLKKFESTEKANLKDTKEIEKLKSSISKLNVENFETIATLKKEYKESETLNKSLTNKVEKLTNDNEKKSSKMASEVKKKNADLIKKIEVEGKRLQRKQRSLRKERENISTIKKSLEKSAQFISKAMTKGQLIDDPSILEDPELREAIDEVIARFKNKREEKLNSTELPTKPLDVQASESESEDLMPKLEDAQPPQRVAPSNTNTPRTEEESSSMLTKPEAVSRPASEVPTMRLKLASDADDYEHKLVITYGFDNMPENMFYSKYKKILKNAARITLLGNLQEGLDMFTLVRDQNLPKEYKEMIEKNIQDITYYLRGLHRVRME